MRALETTKAELHARTANLAHAPEEQVQEEEAAAAEAAKKKAGQARKPRVVTDPELDDDGNVVEESKVTFPMLDLLFNAALETGKEVTRASNGRPAARRRKRSWKTRGRRRRRRRESRRSRRRRSRRSQRSRCRTRGSTYTPRCTQRWSSTSSGS